MTSAGRFSMKNLVRISCLLIIVFGLHYIENSLKKTKAAIDFVDRQQEQTEAVLVSYERCDDNTGGAPCSTDNTLRRHIYPILICNSMSLELEKKYWLVPGCSVCAPQNSEWCWTIVAIEEK